MRALRHAGADGAKLRASDIMLFTARHDADFSARRDMFARVEEKDARGARMRARACVMP